MIKDKEFETVLIQKKIEQEQESVVEQIHLKSMFSSLKSITIHCEDLVEV